MHPVVSIAQLESGPNGENPYARARNFDPPPVIEEDDTATDLYEIETLLKKREFNDDRKVEYLVKWLDYNNKHNVWYKVENL